MMACVLHNAIPIRRFSSCVAEVTTCATNLWAKVFSGLRVAKVRCRTMA